MTESPPRSSSGASAGDPVSVSLVIDVEDDKLRCPQLMDPQAIENLARKGFEIYPAFRMRGRKKVDFDICLAGGEEFSFVGDFVAHT